MGRKGPSTFLDELKDGQDACLGSLAVKSQAGELVAILSHYKQGEEEAN